MSTLDKIQQLIEPTLTTSGYELVRLLFQGAETNKTLQVMVERQDRADMKVEDCELLSKSISAILDVEDPISDRYVLEVTSPGIDRPLIKIEDYERFKGFEAKVETLLPIDTRKRFKGKLTGLNGQNVQMDFEGNAIEIPFSSISKAKLVLTDELVASFLKNKK